jgi:hypothetical protein
VQLRQAQAESSALPAPVEIAAAQLTLTEQEARLENIRASLGTAGGAAGPRFAGWVTLPRGCARAEQCEASFSLRANELNTDELNRMFNPRLHSRPWYLLWEGEPTQPTLFRRLRARGQVAADRLVIKKVVATDATAEVLANSGRVTLKNVSATLFDGQHHGDWTLDFSSPQPLFNGSGRVARISLAEVSAAMQDLWASGTADIRYKLRFSGDTAEAQLKSAVGDVDFTWKHGLLNHLVLAANSTEAAEGLRFARFQGHASFKDGLFALAPSKIETSGGIYEISGTASLERALSLKLALRGSHRYRVEGSLQAPRVIAEAADGTAPSSPGAGVLSTVTPATSGPGIR